MADLSLWWSNTFLHAKKFFPKEGNNFNACPTHQVKMGHATLIWAENKNQNNKFQPLKVYLNKL